MQKQHSAPEQEWEDAKTVLTTGSGSAMEASWFLTRNRVWPLVKSPTWGPVTLGVVLACIVIISVVLSPSAESHFIYTDF